jgi:hypothetical protein|tara:strand:+ start:331 stop:732 length:402 start_codon:yes stop_codon:yes gene_type:complete
MKTLIFLIVASISLIVFGNTREEIQTQQPKEPVIQNSWTKADSRAYARDRLSVWQQQQWLCLGKLWGKESAWNYRAFNKIKVMGKNAGGIPQLLGLSIDTPPTRQIERGLDYIYYRYHTPCKAWQHFQQKGWH